MTNADKFKHLFGIYATELWAMPENDFLEWLNADAQDMPTVERKTGKWIVHPYKIGEERYECDNCHGRCDREYKYCPQCGSYNGGGS